MTENVYLYLFHSSNYWPTSFLWAIVAYPVSMGSFFFHLFHLSLPGRGIDRCFSQPRWPKILGALQHAYDACSFKGRAEMQLRLRSRFSLVFFRLGGPHLSSHFSRVGL